MPSIFRMQAIPFWPALGWRFVVGSTKMNTGRHRNPAPNMTSKASKAISLCECGMCGDKLDPHRDYRNPGNIRVCEFCTTIYKCESCGSLKSGHNPETGHCFTCSQFDGKFDMVWICGLAKCRTRITRERIDLHKVVHSRSSNMYIPFCCDSHRDEYGREQ